MNLIFENLDSKERLEVAHKETLRLGLDVDLLRYMGSVMNNSIYIEIRDNRLYTAGYTNLDGSRYQSMGDDFYYKVYDMDNFKLRNRSKRKTFKEWCHEVG